MKTYRIVLAIFVLLLGASFILAQDVSIVNNPGTDWTKYKTYMWGKNTAAANPMTDQHIVAGIDAKLAAQKLTKVTENPDLIVVYQVGASESVQWNGMGGFRGMGSGSIEKVYTGQLVIDLADVANKQYVWQGTATDSVTSDNAKTIKKIDKALDKMFKNFPNKP